MDLGVFYEVIVPLMEVKGTATICISTPLGTWNFYSELTEVRDDRGKRVFNVRHITHGKRPSWKPEEAYSKVKAIFGNRDKLFQREIEGQITDDNSPAFPAALLKRAFDNQPLDSAEEVNKPDEPIIYVAIDPNGGASAPEASGSDTAIVSYYHSGGRTVVRRGVCRCCVYSSSCCRFCSRFRLRIAAAASRYSGSVGGK
jgi:hypothetical protein